MKKDIELSIFTFDPDKKDYITRSSLEKLMKEIKIHLSKGRKIVLVIKEDL